MARTPATRRAFACLTPALLATTLAACATANGNPPPQAFGSTGGAAVIRVINRQYFDMGVYVVAGGVSHRLGTVDAFQSRDFRIPGALLGGGGQVSFLGDPVGSNVVRRSLPVPVWGGRRVLWEIGNVPATSAISVY